MKRKIIDGHMHLAQWESADGKTIFNNIREYQESAGLAAIDNMCCSNNGDLWGGFEADQSILGAIAKLENPTVFTHGCLYLPKDHTRFKAFNFKDQLDELMELGLDGIKICDFKPDAYKLFHLDEHLAQYDEFIGYCEKNNVHMCWHVADPETFWDPNQVPEKAKKVGWFYGDGTFPTYEKLIGIAYDFLDAHPGLNVLLAHMFFKSFHPDEVVRLLDKYPGVCLDMAPGWEMFEGFKTHRDKWAEIFRKYSTRIVYATDVMFAGCPEFSKEAAQLVIKFLETDEEFEVRGGHLTKGIKLEENHLDNIFCKNHERTVGKTPREINKIALKKYIERYLPFVHESKNKYLTEDYYRRNLIK
jgi:predicted TIM-barrel fold metal-dependent hydrolase